MSDEGNGPRRDVLELAAAIAEGRPVDWVAASGDSPQDPAPALDGLALLEHVAKFHARLAPAGHDQRRASVAQPDEGGSWAPAPDCWGPLHILEKVGFGTFGDVYRAWDTRLDREVALKLMRRREPSGDAMGTAVVEEGRLMAKVRHPSVVTVYGAERIEDRVGLWMEFVHGKTLEQELANRGPFDTGEAARVGSAVCRAVSAIHEAGLVHRDVKAQNVMRANDGRVVVTDFGTGLELGPLSVGGSSGGDAPAETRAQTLAGTPLYLAPEVLGGGPATPRSDIYSIGVLLYRLVTGRYPVMATSIEELREAYASGRVCALKEARTGLDSGFVSVVQRAIDPAPERRFTTAHALADALDALARRPRRGAAWRAAVGFTASVLAVGAAGAWYWHARSTHVSPIASQSAVLLLPFENAVGEPGLDVSLALALERELLASPSITIVSRGRVDDTLALMQRKPGTPIDAALAREVCLRDGEIGAYVTGRAERAVTGIALTVVVRDPRADRTLAILREVVRDVADAPRGVRLIATGVRRSLGQSAREIEEAAQQLERVTTSSLRALRLYSASWELGNRFEWAAALTMIDDAIREDPAFAAAHTWKAWCILNTRMTRGGVPEAFLSEAERGVALADAASDWERYWIRGSYHQMRRDYAAAVPQFEALLHIIPDHQWALSNLEIGLRVLGRPDETLPFALRAADARPSGVDQQAVATMLLLNEGALDRAESYAARVRQLTARGRHTFHAGIQSAWLLPSDRAWLAGDMRRAVRELEQAGQGPAFDSTGRNRFEQGVFISYLRMGRIDEARRTAIRFGTPREQHVRLALVAHFAGEPGGVLDELDRADLGQRLAELDGDLTLEKYSLVSAVLSAVWLHLQHGRVNDAARVAQNIPERALSPLIPPYLAGLRELALGQLERATRTLSFDIERLGGDIYFRHASALADALVRTGDRARGIDTLRRALASRPWAHSQRGDLFRMAAQRQLSALLRGAGRHEEAGALDAEAQRLLAGADPRFVLARGL